MANLKIDYTIDKLIKEIVQEVNKEQNLKGDNQITYDLVVKCLEQQLNDTVNGLSKGNKVVWKFFGSFIASKKRVDNLNKLYTKLGYPITLEDYGVQRVSFKKTGEKIDEIDTTKDLTRLREKNIYPSIATEKLGIKQDGNI